VDVGGQIVDTAIGLTFVFVALSLVCSFIQEVIAFALSWRPKLLERGIRSMLQRQPEAGDDTPGLDFADEVLGSTFITEKVSERARRRGRRTPSYLTPRTFALALLDTLAKSENDGALLDKARFRLGRVLPEDHPVRRQIDLLLEEAGGNLDRFQRSVEDWYGDMMDRVSGWYKRRTQLALVVIGITVAGIANADTLEVTSRLWKEDAVRASIVAQASEAVQGGSLEDLEQRLEERGTVIDGVKQLDLPIGWNDANGRVDDLDVAGGDDSTLGWLLGVVLTGLALSFGAPVWFDALNKLSRLRIAGRKPEPRPER
jgi:hypothetical protein